MRKDNLDVVGDKCIKDDSGNLAISDAAKMYCLERALLSPSQCRILMGFREPINDKPNAGVPLFIKAEMVNNAITKVEPGKASGRSGIDAEMLKSSGTSGTNLIADLINAIIKYGEVPSDWESSYIINLYKGKGDALEKGNHRGLKLL